MKKMMKRFPRFIAMLAALTLLFTCVLAGVAEEGEGVPPAAEHSEPAPQHEQKAEPKAEPRPATNPGPQAGVDDSAPPPNTSNSAGESEPAGSAGATENTGATEAANQGETPLEGNSTTPPAQGENGQPATETPDGETPAAEGAPEEGLPEAQLPGEGVPEGQLPEEGSPETELPGEELPSEELPGEELPSEELPSEELIEELLPDEAELPSVFTVSFYVQETAILALQVEPGAAIANPGITPTAPEGWAFDYWYETEGAPYAFGAPVESDLDLHAAFSAPDTAPEPASFTVTYWVGQSPVLTVDAEAGAAIAAPDIDPAAPQGLAFDYWYEAQGVPYAFGAPVESDLDLRAAFSAPAPQIAARIYSNADGLDVVYPGDQITLYAEVEGLPDGAAYTAVWQYDAGNGWVTAAEGAALTHTFTLTEENYSWQWILRIHTAGAVAEEAIALG